jgi:predicted PurR-regulated permease PerM
VQFDTLGSFIVLVLSLTAIQLVIGSVLESMLMGAHTQHEPVHHHPVARFLESNLRHLSECY